MTSNGDPVPSPLVGIVVPTYNRPDLLKKCLDSIRANAGVHHEVIAVDGGSTDDTVEFLESLREVRSILEGRLTGAVNAYNTGFAASGARYLCSLTTIAN